MMEQNDKIKQMFKLLQKGEMEPKAMEEFLKLLSENNLELNASFKDAWEEVGNTSDQFDNKANLNKLKKVLFKKQIERRQKIRSLFISGLKYAAILFIGYLIAMLYYNPFEDKSIADNPGKNYRISVPFGSKANVELPDGSQVSLNSGSVLTYSKDFGKNSRIVTLEGQGYFDVSENKQVPFYVKTKDIVIKVLGTKFDVKSYPEDTTTETTLLSGKIEIYSKPGNQLPSKNDSPNAVLYPMQQAITGMYENDSITAIKNNKGMVTGDIKPIEIKVIKQPYAELKAEWRNEKLIIENIKFNEILVILERWYYVDIQLNYKEISDMRFSGKFDNESIYEVLDVLSMIEKFDYSIEKNKIIISK